MWRKLRADRMTWLADGVVRVDLADPEGRELPTWEPGAHLPVHLPNRLVREYSLCGDPDNRTTLSVAVLREESSRGGSSWVHDHLTVGTLLDVDEPRNNFPLEPARKYVVVAGGIGITPMLPMAWDLARSGSSWHMIYCGRSRSGMAFLPELREVAGSRLSVHADDEHGGPADLEAELCGIEPGTLVYCCGPEPLIEAVESALPDRSALRVERFRAPRSVPDESTQDEAAGFDVVCSGSGLRVRVDPGVSILQALEGAGFDVPSSCEEGICGTCETKVLDGRPRHRDHVLGDAERESGETMMICVSGSRSPEIVLELP